MTVRAATWSATVVLCLITVLSAAGRTADVVIAPYGSGLSAGDQLRLRALSGLFQWDPGDPRYLDAKTHVVGISEHFRAHPLMTLLHVLPGALVLTLGPLQFASHIRTRRPALHRWSGRILLVAALAVGFTGLYFGVVEPYAGLPEAIPSLVFGALFLYAAARAFIAVRRRDFINHREWMLRMFGLAVGVGTIRLVGLGLVGLGVGLRALIGASFAIGWVFTFLVAELWIRSTRPRAA